MTVMLRERIRSIDIAAIAAERITMSMARVRMMCADAGLVKSVLSARRIVGLGAAHRLAMN
jgi:hypothetical protein